MTQHASIWLIYNPTKALHFWHNLAMAWQLPLQNLITDKWWQVRQNDFFAGLTGGKTVTWVFLRTIPHSTTVLTFSMESTNMTPALFILDAAFKLSYPTTFPTVKLHSFTEDSMLTGTLIPCWQERFLKTPDPLLLPSAMTPSHVLAAATESTHQPICEPWQCLRKTVWTVRNWKPNL